jgi:SAM-dependent methyltransferase
MSEPTLTLANGNTLSMREAPDLVSGAILQCGPDEVATQLAFEAVFKLLRDHEFGTVLDVGCGKGEHTTVFRHAGKSVTSLDPVEPADVRMDLFDYAPQTRFDLVFCSHVLEHQRNIGLFLDRLISLTREGGLLCVTVPPVINPQILLCHPNQFSAGLLIYHLVMAGLDCRDAEICTYGYNVSVITRKIRNGLELHSWAPREEAGQYMPAPFEDFRQQSFNRQMIYGPLRSFNWEPALAIPPHPNSLL